MTGSRIILRLALGVLCGVALVLLPAVFSTGTASAPATSYAQNSRGAQPATLSPLAPSIFALNSAAVGALSLFNIILFIFLPSTIFSILVRRWAERKAQGYLE